MTLYNNKLFDIHAAYCCARFYEEYRHFFDYSWFLLFAVLVCFIYYVVYIFALISYDYSM